MRFLKRCILVFFLFIFTSILAEGLPLYYWQTSRFVNFGDYLSLEIVERMVSEPIKVIKTIKPATPKKLLAVGSVLRFAKEGDVIWGTGVSGRSVCEDVFSFKNLEVKGVRGPLTAQFLKDKKGIDCPEVYGDPVLLFPQLFPEYKRNPCPEYDYIVIPHFSEIEQFPREKHVVYPIDDWREIVKKVLNSKFVISSSLHGIILAEAYGIPARMLRVSENESLFKYIDYYLGTQRPDFRYATSVEEALEMGGEAPFCCDLNKIYEAFPFEYWK